MVSDSIVERSIVAGLFFQGLAFHDLQGPRDDRYLVHRLATTTIDFSSLVSPCICARLLFLQVTTCLPPADYDRILEWDALATHGLSRRGAGLSR